MRGLQGLEVPKETWVNEALEAQMVTKDLGETVGILATRAPKESLVTKAQLDQLEFEASRDPRVSQALQGSRVSREPQERMEPLVSKESKEILASRVPGASRVKEE